MNDWELFVEEVPWFLEADDAVCVSTTTGGFHLPSTVARKFPAFARLLDKSLVTPVSVNNHAFNLIAWNAAGAARMGWLCPASKESPPADIHRDHADLLRCFGGIVERFNEPDETWLLNQDDVLTRREAANDASLINDYLWAFEEEGVELPIQTTDYYVIARECNGNATLCHRKTGRVLLFAPDHCFDHVTRLQECPENTLYTLDGVATLRDWVNQVAEQWLSYIDASK